MKAGNNDWLPDIFRAIVAVKEIGITTKE